MNENNDKNGFKVVDRRGGSSQDNAERSQELRGETFVAKDVPEKQEVTPPEKLDFSALCLSFATSALIQLGLTPDPVTKKKVKNIELAKQNIEVLELLQSKTKGNLTTDEEKLLTSILTEVRLRFVEAVQQKS